MAKVLQNPVPNPNHVYPMKCDHVMTARTFSTVDLPTNPWLTGWQRTWSNHKAAAAHI